MVIALKTAEEETKLASIVIFYDILIVNVDNYN